ncbi:MAG: AraC family transcriptional regulator, partial [Ruminococcus sp.]|nr:AraC family transcriptional regulator [Ruminococcus sp.]
VEKNYKNDISMKSVADLVGLSPTYFSKYFKNVADVSFIRYLNLVRLEHALNDMFYDNQNVTNAAMNNGFANVKSFIELCKKIYGHTPTEYKKRILANE